MRLCGSEAGRRCARVAALAFVAGLAGAGIGRAEPADFIHAQGTRLVDGRGEEFAVKGINLGNWLLPEGYMFKFKRALSPAEIGGLFDELIGPQAASDFWAKFRDVYVAKDDIDFIKTAGFNTIRVPLNWRLFIEPGTDGAADRFEGPGWALLDRLVQWCHEAGLRAILDLHAAPGGQTGANHDDGPGFPLLFYVPRYRALTIALWQKLAARYRDETAILGYDVLNEPISSYSDVDYLNPQLEPLYRDIVAAIRSVDPNHVVLLDGAQWSTNFAVFGRPFDNNVVYTYHKFWANATRDALQEYIDFSNRWNVPILIGETGESSDAWNVGFRQLHERFNIGWCFWTYKNLDSKLSVVSIRRPAGWSLIAKAGSVDADALDASSLPPRQEAQSILDAYLEAAKFQNDRVNTGYLSSLGLAVP